MQHARDLDAVALDAHAVRRRLHAHERVAAAHLVGPARQHRQVGRLRVRGAGAQRDRRHGERKDEKPASPFELPSIFGLLGETKTRYSLSSLVIANSEASTSPWKSDRTPGRPGLLLLARSDSRSSPHDKFSRSCSSARNRIAAGLDYSLRRSRTDVPVSAPSPRGRARSARRSRASRTSWSRSGPARRLR